MTCTDCPEKKEEPMFFKCPHCDWSTLADSCQVCINKHLRDKHNMNVEIGEDKETEDMLKWYGKKYGKEFRTISELDTYILLNNLDNS